jgi:hypothetical protein
VREDLTTAAQIPRTVEFTFPDQTLPARHIEGPGSVPRITRLMALATKFQILIQQGVVRDYADLARLGRVSRARITQLMNLLNLAPDIQEQLLFLNIMDGCRAPITERTLRAVVKVPHWDDQRKLLATFVNIETVPDSRSNTGR